ncbi:MAG: serine/threonine-protein kinase [Polyangiaceae bacterium]
MGTSKPPAEPAADSRRRLPYQLDRYTLFDWVGRGGMADIYLARVKSDFGASRLVVIKEVLPHLRDDDHFADMLIQEAKLAAQLSHANIITVEDLGRHDGTIYIAMEYLEGIDLRDVLRQCSKRKIRLPLGYSLTVMCEVLRALDYAHRFSGHDGQMKGIVHRDVSPSNVLLSFDGEVKLCDFGIASVMTVEGVDADTIEGKAGYMSPEQARGEAIDTRSDLYSAGILLWELLNGRRLYRSREGMALIDVAREAKVPALREQGLPHEAKLHALVMRALSTDLDERFATAAEMHAELEDYCVGAKMLVTPMRLGRWLSEHFEDDRIQQRRARQRAVQALDQGPLLIMDPISEASVSSSDAGRRDEGSPPSSRESSPTKADRGPLSRRGEANAEIRKGAVPSAIVAAIAALLLLLLLRAMGVF